MYKRDKLPARVADLINQFETKRTISSDEDHSKSKSSSSWMRGGAHHPYSNLESSITKSYKPKIPQKPNYSSSNSSSCNKNSYENITTTFSATSHNQVKESCLSAIYPENQFNQNNIETYSNITYRHPTWISSPISHEKTASTTTSGSVNVHDPGPKTSDSFSNFPPPPPKQTLIDQYSNSSFISSEQSEHIETVIEDTATLDTQITTTQPASKLHEKRTVSDPSDFERALLKTRDALLEEGDKVIDLKPDFKTIDSLKRPRGLPNKANIDEIETFESPQDNTNIIFNNGINDPELHYVGALFEQSGIEAEDPSQEDCPVKSRILRFSTDPMIVSLTYAKEDYQRRGEGIDPLAATAQYELEKRIAKMDTIDINVEKAQENGSLGISIIGMGVGADAGMEKLGIFVKRITEGGSAHKTGKFRIGDMLVEVDGISLVGVTQAFAHETLFQTGKLVTFQIAREKEGEQSEIQELIKQSLQMDLDEEQRNKFDEYSDEYELDPLDHYKEFQEKLQAETERLTQKNAQELKEKDALIEDLETQLYNEKKINAGLRGELDSKEGVLLKSRERIVELEEIVLKLKRELSLMKNNSIMKHKDERHKSNDGMMNHNGNNNIKIDYSVGGRVRNSLNQPKTRTLGSLLNGQSYSSMGLNSRSSYSTAYNNESETEMQKPFEMGSNDVMNMLDDLNDYKSNTLPKRRRRRQRALANTEN